MAIDKESLKKMFPNLYKELELQDCKISIDAVRKNAEEAENCESEEECESRVETTKPDKLRHFNPTALDFIRRCNTEEQAEEIIAYLQKKGEITKADADELLMRLKGGVRVFGPKKDENFYFREGGIF